MRVSTIEQSPEFTRWLQDTAVTADEFTAGGDAMAKEYRWYIAGKYCEMEKQNRKRSESIRSTFMRIGRELGCTDPMIRRFLSYYHAIQSLNAVAPDVVSDIFSGKLKLSVETTRSLAKMRGAEIRLTAERIKSGKEKICVIFPERAAKPVLPKRGKRIAHATVKDPPPYDPDAPVAGLTFTIASWVSAIDRVFMSNHIHEVSRSASRNLMKELSLLRDATDILMKLLSETCCRERA